MYDFFTWKWIAGCLITCKLNCNALKRHLDLLICTFDEPRLSNALEHCLYLNYSTVKAPLDQHFQINTQVHNFSWIQPNWRHFHVIRKLENIKYKYAGGTHTFSSCQNAKLWKGENALLLIIHKIDRIFTKKTLTWLFAKVCQTCWTRIYAIFFITGWALQRHTIFIIVEIANTSCKVIKV